MTETVHHPDSCICVQCEHDRDALQRTRRMADDLVSAADASLARLDSLDQMLGEMAHDGIYAEYFSSDNDADALADIGDAQRFLRSFARIARGRAIRTGQQS